MIWLALLLVGVSVSDLAHSSHRRWLLPEALGALSVVLLGLASGLTGTAEVVGLALLAAGVVAWARSVTWGFRRERSWLPLTVLGALVVGAVAVSGSTDASVGGLLQRWWSGLDWGPATGTDATRALLVAGVLLVQLSTGNVLVRLVLQASGTMRRTVLTARGDAAFGPLTSPTGAITPPAPGPFPGAGGGALEDAPSSDVTLKGGRLLGPMERLLIVGLALAGNLTAASIVVAAKGLLRFPELQSRRDQEQIHRLTEYFLVGSFISWLVALGGVALVAA